MVDIKFVSDPISKVGRNKYRFIAKN